MSGKPSPSPITRDRALSLQPVSQQHYGSGQHYPMHMPPSNPPRYNEADALNQSESTPLKDQPPQPPGKQLQDQQAASSEQAQTTENISKHEAGKGVVAEAPVSSIPASGSEKSHGEAKNIVEVVPEVATSSSQIPASAEAASAAEGAGNDVLTASAIHPQEPKEQETTTAADGDEEAISGAWIPWIQDPASEEFLEGASDEGGKIPLSPSNGRTTGDAVINDPEVKSAADETDDIWGWVSSPKNSP